MIQTIAYRNGETLAYTETGDPDGFPVLVQHGMVASITDAPGLFACLIERGARVIAPARPGYGESTPYILKNIGEWGEIAAALVDSLGLVRFDVLGISSGAPFAYAVARALPDQVRRVFILSGIPALYDKAVQRAWPYPVNQNTSLDEMRALARELFFANLSPGDHDRAEIRDSMMNDCFGPAQDLRIRVMDWGFRLDEVRASVTMSHSRSDLLETAELTARLLPDCRLIVREDDVHFSQEVLDGFIRTFMAEQ